MIKKEKEVLKVYFSFSNLYNTMQALHFLTTNEIDAMPEEGKLSINKKDESKAKDIFKKFGLPTPKCEYKKVKI